jgi:hypothetical protein
MCLLSSNLSFLSGFSADQSNHRDNNNGMFPPPARDFLIDPESKFAGNNRNLGDIEYLANQLKFARMDFSEQYRMKDENRDVRCN